MRITNITVNYSMSKVDTIDAIKSNLSAIAKAHNVDVDALLDSAHSAGVSGPDYLRRALVLEKRLEKLSQE